MTASLLQGLTLDQSHVLQLISADVEGVELELSRQVGSEVALVEGVGRHTLEAGGKRLRPAFLALSAKATGLPYEAGRAQVLGACLEMIHMATLVHDDVIDHSPTRRGRPTASALYGNTGSILAGDVLLAKAMVLLAKDGDLDIIRTVSESVVEMAEGEVRELELRGCFDLDEAEHLEVLRMKTAAFIQACCEVGAILTQAPLPIRLALRDYGFHVGMAFQIVDDLLDYRGEGEKTGKQQAGDYREGQATLPLILLRESLSESEAALVRRGFGQAEEADVLHVAALMSQRDSFALTEAAAQAHIEQALAAARLLPPSPSRHLLEATAQFVIRREG